MTRTTNPTGSMLLDRSSAHPGSIDKSVFEKKGGSSAAGNTVQGTVNSNYLRECREDNPEPTSAQDETGSVNLSACKITTPPENLVVDQPFEMSVEVKSANATPSGQATFRLFCTIPDPAGGSPKCEDQSLSFSGKITDGVAKASGKLISPKKSVPAGTKLQYHVVAEHADAKEKSECPKVEVESGKPPKPLAVWSLGAVHFGFDSSFILPSAAAKIADFKAEIDKHPGAALAVFGHADPVGEDDANKGLSGRRAFAMWCLLAKDPTGWTQLASADKWDLRTTQTMLSHLKDKAASAPYYGGSIDGKTGPKTESAIKAFRADHSLGNGTTLDTKSKEGLYKAYMESVCEVTCKPEDFVGDPKDTKRQWACVGCSEFNPVLVFSKADDAKFRNESDKTERNAKNAPNRRATVFLFPPGAKGPGNVEFPCPAWSDGVANCRKQFFEDADKRRNPSDAERTWEKDTDTFACKFYAELGEGGSEAGTDGPEKSDFDVPPQKQTILEQPITENPTSEEDFEPFLVASADDRLVASLIQQAREKHTSRRTDSTPKTRPGGNFLGFRMVAAIAKPTLRHDHGFLDDGNGNLDLSRMESPTAADYLSLAKWTGMLVGAETLRPDLADATQFYRHFLSTSGRDYPYDYEHYVDSDRAGEFTIESAIEDTRAASIEFNDLFPSSGSFLIQTDAFGIGSSNSRYLYPGTENWQKAIGAHLAWIEANVLVETTDGKRHFDIHMILHVEDMYNFNPHNADIATGIKDAENGRFEITGLGKEFLSTSLARRRIRFSCGLEPQTNYRAQPSDQSVRKERR